MLTTIKGEIDSNTIVVWDFNFPFIPVDRSTRQKVNKKTQALKDTLYQLDLTDVYRAFYPKTAAFTFYQAHMEISPE